MPRKLVHEFGARSCRGREAQISNAKWDKWRRLKGATTVSGSWGEVGAGGLQSGAAGFDTRKGEKISNSYPACLSAA